MTCKKHPDEELIPSYFTDPNGDHCLEGMWCVKCMAEKPIRIPFRYEVRK